MLRGEVIGLQARQDSYVEVFQAELLNAVETRMRSDSRPWRPGRPTRPTGTRVLCRYGLAVRGLHRLQVDTPQTTTR